MYKGALTVCIVLLLSACSSLSPKAKAVMNQPVNCATAERDIKTLETEKHYHVSQLGGGYERELQEEIDEIKKTCGL